MIDGFSIKTGEKSDAAAIRNLVRKAYAKWVPLIGRDPLPMSVNYEQVILSHRFDLVYKDKTLVALIETIEKTDHLLIQNLCVSPKHQRVGVGRSLLNYAEYLAQQSGYKTLRLDTNKLFLGNVDLYHSHGYLTDWEKPIDGGIHVHMKKSIA